MKKLSAAIIILFGLANAALAQVVPPGDNPSPMAGAYNSVAPTCTSGQFCALQVDVNGNLKTAGSSSLSGSTSNATDGQATNATNLPAVAYNYVFNGTTWDRQRATPSGDAIIGLGNAGSSNILFNGTTWDRQRTIVGAVPAGTGSTAVAIAPTSVAAGGITPVVSPSAESGRVLKASAGNLYSVYATNLTATDGFLIVVNSTTVPADGAVTPIECVPLPANPGVASINYNPGPPSVFSTGISAFVSSAATCYTKTTGVITAFIKGSVQ